MGLLSWGSSKQAKGAKDKSHVQQEPSPVAPMDTHVAPHSPLGAAHHDVMGEPELVERDPFPELTKILKKKEEECDSSLSQLAGKMPDPILADLKYAKFTIAGFPGEKHAIFIPDHIQISPAIFEDLCLALRQEIPSMMLTGVSALTHPSEMTTPQLRDCPGFEQLMSEAKSNLGIGESEGQSLCPCGHLPDESAEERIPMKGYDSESERATRKALEDFANKVLEKKVTTLVSGIASACHQTNAWTFRGPHVSNFDLFLQRCLENNETDVFNVVAAHMQDKSYMESKLGRDLLKQLFQSSEAMSPKTVDEYDPICLSGDLWCSRKNPANMEFRENGFDYWSFNTCDDAARVHHPIAQWPWPWADLFLLFYRAETRSNSGDADWDFHTDKRLDRDAVPLQVDQLAPPGYVFIGGSVSTKKKLLQVMQVVRPTVLIDNTPDVAKQMSLFLNIVKRALVGDKAACKPYLLDGSRGYAMSAPTVMELLQALSPSKILKQVEKNFDTSGMDAVARLTLSDVVGMLDLVKHRPQVFRETFCVVDPLRDCSDQVVSQLSSAFCSSHTGTSDSTSNPVNRTLILKGWRLHSKLTRSANHLMKLATGMEVLVELVMFIATVISVVMISLRLEQDRVKESVLSGYMPHHIQMDQAFPYSDTLVFLGVFMPVFPISAGILLTLQSHFQFTQKWGNVNLAASQVVSEIYQFLGNSGGYCGTASVNRQRFLKRLQDVVKNLSMSGTREDDFLQGDDEAGEAFSTDPDALLNHINLALYGIHAPGWLRRKAQRVWYWAGAELLEEGRPAPLTAQDQHMDLTSPMTADMYMEMRVAPLTKYYNNWAKANSSIRMQLNIVVFLCLGIGSGLAAFGISLWIPVTVGGATFMTALSRWLSPPEFLTAVNNALTILNNLDLRWHGSSLKEQRSDHMRRRLIQEAEKAVLGVSTTLSRAPLLPEEDDDMLDNEGDRDDIQYKQHRALSGSTTPGLTGWSQSQSRQRSTSNTPRSSYHNSGGAWM